MSKKKGKMAGMNALERAIYTRERGIDRMRENIKRVRADAEVEVAAIERRIGERSVLLRALKRGQLSPSK